MKKQANYTTITRVCQTSFPQHRRYRSEISVIMKDIHHLSSGVNSEWVFKRDTLFIN